MVSPLACQVRWRKLINGNPMTVAIKPLPSILDVEQCFARIQTHRRKDRVLMPLVEFARLQDMIHKTLQAGDNEQFGALKNAIDNISSRPGLTPKGIDDVFYKHLCGTIELLSWAASMHPSGADIAAPKNTLISYITLLKPIHVSQKAHEIAETGNWDDFTTLIAYLTQDKENIRDESLINRPDQIKDDILNSLECALAIHVGRQISVLILKVLAASQEKHIPDALVALLRQHETVFAKHVRNEGVTGLPGSTYGLLNEYKRLGLNQLYSATIDVAMRSYECPAHFLTLAAHGVVKDPQWHAEQFRECKDGSNSPAVAQVVFFIVKGGPAYLPPLDELPPKTKAEVIVEACNQALKIDPACLPRIIEFLQEKVVLGDIGRELVDKGLDEEISKHVGEIRGLAFTNALGV